MSNPGNVIGGHKANLNNPNTSDEAKQHSKEVLSSIDNGGEVPTSNSSSSGGEKNTNNVAGGLKATLNNPNTSDEAKQSAKERLGEMN
ncbi:Conidiation-specific protein 6 [Pyrenophora tritici-repentis]|nr:Conidiation-specific protein 6 [Pyrenophora tritici-repentis]